MRVTFCLLFSLLLSVPTAVAAESSTRPVEQTYVDQAVALFTDGNYSAALKQFQTLLNNSRDAQQRIRLQWNVARCLEMLGRFEEALAEFYAYQSIIEDPKRKARAVAKINQLHPKVYGILSVTCSEETAFEVLHRPNTTPEKPQNFGPLACPAEVDSLRPGSAIISAMLEGVMVKNEVSVAAGEISHIFMKPPDEASRTAYIVGGVVAGVVMLGVGYYLLMQPDESTPRLRTGTVSELQFE